MRTIKILRVALAAWRMDPDCTLRDAWEVGRAIIDDPGPRAIAIAVMLAPRYGARLILAVRAGGR